MTFVALASNIRLIYLAKDSVLDSLEFVPPSSLSFFVWFPFSIQHGASAVGQYTGTVLSRKGHWQLGLWSSTIVFWAYVKSNYRSCATWWWLVLRP